MRSKKKLIVLLVIVLAGVALTAWQMILRRQPGDLKTVKISGNIEVTETQVSFKVPGRVQERLVSEGEGVKAGQVIAVLDKTEFQQEVALRQAEVAAAASSLEELEAGSRPEEIAQARAVLERARSEAANMKADYARQVELHRKDVISTRELDAARTAFETTQARVKEAEQQWLLVREGPRREKIDQARARLDQARQALGLAETKLGYATVFCPLDGIVLSKNIEPGEYVSPGTPVVTVADLENVWLRGYILETDLGRVKLGQEVRVSADTYPGRVYKGIVSFISPEAEFTPKTVQTEKERVKLVYRIKVDIRNLYFELKSGMPADAEIILDAPQHE